MENLDNTNLPPPPPPPPNGRGTPPVSPLEPTPKRRPSPRPPLAASLTSSTTRRPQLVRRDSSSQGSFRRGRERTSTTDSQSSYNGFRQHRSGHSRTTGFEPQQQNYGMNSDYPVQPMTMDTRLLLASVDNDAMEDKAENTLLDVLERRQVTFANHDAVAPPSYPSGRAGRHRRNRSRYASVLPNIDMLNLAGASMQRPSSAPSSIEAAQQPLSRPNILPSRSISHGRSKRNLLRNSPPAMTGSGRAVTADWAFDASDSRGDLVQNFSELSDLHGVDFTSSNSPKDTMNRTASHDSEEKGNPSPPNHPWNRPMGFHRGTSDSSSQMGLTTPGERARYVALKMKTNAANNTEVPNLYSMGEDGDLADLMNTMEAQRDNDNISTGSPHKSGGSSLRSGGGFGIRSRGSRSHNGTRSAESHSKGGSSAFSGSRGRPFSGITSSPFSSNGFMSNIDQLFQVADLVQDLCQIPEEEEGDGPRDVTQSDVVAHENANFLSQLQESHPEVPTAYSEEAEEAPKGENGEADEQTPMLRQGGRRVSQFSPQRRTYTSIFSSITTPHPGSRFYKILLWWAELRKSIKMLVIAFDIPYVKERLWDFFQNDVTMWIMPALAVSAFFYYKLNNPVLSVLPTDASISWWVLFAIRHYLTLHLAYAAEYVFVDTLAMRSLVSVQLIGPLATLYTINAKGWPFTLTIWGLLNLLLIQAGQNTNNVFFGHWLFWSEIEMFAEENPSGAVVESDVYGGILASMIIAGIATSLKRTILALYLGKRIYIHYKPKLEKVMESMILLTEVADLGNAIGDFEFEKVDTPNVGDRIDSKKSLGSRPSLLQDRIRASAMNTDIIRASAMNDVLCKKPNAGNTESDSDEEDLEDESKGTNESIPWNRLRSGSNSSDEPMEKVPSQETLDKTLEKVSEVNEEDENNVPQRTTTEDFIFAEEQPANTEPPISTIQEPVRGLLHGVSTTTRIKHLLDDWEEPVNKQDKVDDPTIHDILQFRKALSFLDDSHPFGSSFGPAFTRDTCIKSAKSLYTRLLALSPGSPVVHFDILGVLAYNTDGTFDNKKAKSLVRLFRPDKFDDVSLLHFVQSCDGVYKRLRYLRASVGNSTLIDSVLENIFNVVFGFFLALTIMSILRLNPWTLLVSLSTVLVSFAFALGPSAAKLIEGMIMIAVRRPFDLGDRISIVDCTGAPDNSDDPGYHDTWIVEDVNLFTTTLRLSRTNELSTVNNGSIANTRIVNHGRSPNAMVNISLWMRIETSSDQVQIVKSALQQYIRDNPRVWASLINFRITKVDSANGSFVYSARVQHVKSWQDLLPIMQAKGDLENFCAEILMRLGIHWDGSVVTNDVYIKEFPEQEEIIPGDDVPFPDEDDLPEGHHQRHD